MWSEAIVRPLFKEAVVNDENNYRGITKIAGNRFMSWSNEYGKIDESQGAYREGRSTAEHIFTLYATGIRYVSRPKGQFYCTFIDFTKAFDSILHGHLWFRFIENCLHGYLVY